jgi:hypothetical protein
VALLPLVLVGVSNKLFTVMIPRFYGASHEFLPAVIGDAKPVVQEVAKVAAIWAVEGALLVGIASVLLLAWREVRSRVGEGTQPAIAGRAPGIDEYRLGIRLRRGDRLAARFPLQSPMPARDPEPARQRGGHVTALAGITGSASGGMSIALAAMAQTFIDAANAAGNSDGSAAPRGGDGFRRHGHAAAQRRGDHAARRSRGSAPAKLQGHLRLTVLKTVAVFVVIALYYAIGAAYASARS